MSSINVGIESSNIYVIIHGRGTAEYCAELNDFLLNTLSQFHVDNIFFDTSDACYLDSSFIGIILGMKKKLSMEDDKVFLLNPSEKVIDILKIMGLESFLPSIKQVHLCSDNCCTFINKKKENTISDIKLLLESHKHIMETSSENYKRFTLVEKAFQKELEQKQNK